MNPTRNSARLKCTNSSMPKIIPCLFLFLFINGFSQNGLFEKGRSKTLKEITLIDKNDITKVDSKEMVIDDSIKVSSQKFAQKIFAKNLLMKSNSIFEIKYYLKNGNLFYIKIEEQSPRYSDLKKHTEYFINDNKISDINHYQNVRVCLPISIDGSIKNQFGYNENLTENFMRNYVFRLYEKLKNSSEKEKSGLN